MNHGCKQSNDLMSWDLPSNESYPCGMDNPISKIDGRRRRRRSPHKKNKKKERTYSQVGNRHFPHNVCKNLYRQSFFLLSLSIYVYIFLYIYIYIITSYTRPSTAEAVCNRDRLLWRLPITHEKIIVYSEAEYTTVCALLHYTITSRRRMKKKETQEEREELE